MEVCDACAFIGVFMLTKKKEDDEHRWHAQELITTKSQQRQTMESMKPEGRKGDNLYTVVARLVI